jgi:DNA-directed RNA polymerase specialized sigma24 family protein
LIVRNGAREEITMRSLEFQTERDRLSQAILDLVGSLPELHRRIFAAVHYDGMGIEEAGRTAGLDTVEAACILAHCERRLRVALRAFRCNELQRDDLARDGMLRHESDPARLCDLLRA